jgi:uncharacterized protein (TIGR02646 family)
MRFIDNKVINKPTLDWDAQSEAAKNDVITNGIDVDTHSKVWTRCKDVLANKSHDKCWYCEIRQERSDNAVDHFRPKSKYKWLAFGFDNFRYACTYCNSVRRDKETGASGGKGNSFPLVDEGQRATAEGEETNEQPLLLDPCCAHDPLLLDFLDTGQPKARYAEPERRKERVEVSIRLYHLDHTDLIEKRRVLAINLNEEINLANRLFDRVDKGDFTIDQSYYGHVRKLQNAMSEKAELSSFARRVIMGRREIEWVESLIQTH